MGAQVRSRWLLGILNNLSEKMNCQGNRAVLNKSSGCFLYELPLATPNELLLFEISFDAALFDFHFQDYRVASCQIFSRPDQSPWPRKAFGRLRAAIIRIVVPGDAIGEIGCRSAVVSTGGCALQNIDVIRHVPLQ